MNLSPQEKILYDDIISSLSLNEASSLKDTLENINRNWRKWSIPLLTSLMMNPSSAQAIKQYLPNTARAINSEISAKKTTISKSTPQSPNTIQQYNFSDNFSSGKSSLENSPNFISTLKELKKWMSGKDLSKFRVRINSSESQVPNQTPFKTPGSLARARALSLQTVLSKLGFDKIEINNSIGNTPYKPGDNKDDPKFTNEQFVNMEILVNTESICQLEDFPGDGVTGYESSNFITYDNYVSDSGYIILDTGSIPDRLVISNIKGKITKDTGYITTKESPYSDWKYVPLYVSKLTSLYNKNKAVSGSKIKIIRANSYEELIKQLLNDPNNPQYGTKNREIYEGLDELKKQIKSGVREFVIYDKVDGPYKQLFSDKDGDIHVQVHSPLGQTGFNLKGFCKK